MPTTYSLYARQQFNDGHITDVPVMLITISHPNLPEPILLSTDNTELLSMEPLAYGTVSNGKTYLFSMLSVMYPDDIEGQPPSTQLVFENVTEDLAAEVRSITSPATVDIAIVWASAPDAIEEEKTGFKLVGATYDAGQLSLEVSREPVTAMPFQADHMTKGRFPGLHR